MITQEILSLISLTLLVSAIAIQSQSYIKPMIRTIILQSVLLGAITALVGFEESSYELYLLAVLIVFLRGVLISYVLEQRLPRNNKFVREYLPGVASLTLVSIVVIMLSFLLYYFAFFGKLGSPIGAIGLSLMVQGVLLIMTRKNSFAHVIGYIEEENGIIFIGLSWAPLPLLVEINVLLDVFGLVIVSSVLVFEAKEHYVVQELIG